MRGTLVRHIARERNSPFLRRVVRDRERQERGEGEERESTHHVTSRLAPTEPGQLDNCIDFCIMLSVLKFLKQTLGKVFCK